MITNERQYMITRRKARSFARALEEFVDPLGSRATMPARLVRAEREAMESQLRDLQDELTEYDRLKDADLSLISISSFDELADGLIKARIAAGLSQKALAERLGIKEQQIQRYEAERYSSASYQRLCQVSRALGVRIRNDILLPVVPGDFDGLLAKVRQVGLSRGFLVERLLPSADAAVANGEVDREAGDEGLTATAATILERVYGWTHDNIFGAQALSPPRAATAAPRFKMPAKRNEGAPSLFAAYANYLAVVAIKGMDDAAPQRIPTEPAEIRRRILARAGKDDLASTLHAVWDMGVVVLPLRGTGTFHGACWRHGGRNAIVLKQTSPHAARWSFDLLHELYHAAQQPEEEAFALVEAEATSKERRESEEEVAASRFAADVMLDGKAEALAAHCVEAANAAVERLKRAVPRVASTHGVGGAALANYLAFRLSWQGVDWWEAAASLQGRADDPWRTARDVFIERHPYRIDNELDRHLLDRALN